MEDSSVNFVAELRERLAEITVEVPEVTGIMVEEHEFDELDDRTQTAVNKMFETQRIAKAAAGRASDAYNTVKVRTLAS